MKIARVFLLGASLCAAANMQSQSLCFDPAADNRYQCSDWPREIVAGDFDEDGMLDVITANVSGTADFLHGNGDGSFDAPMTISDSAGDEIEVADMNNDGHLDIVRLSDGSGAVKINLGNGDGSFDPGIVVMSGSTGSFMAELTLGHFDNNGFLDIAVNDPDDDLIHLIGNVNGSTFLFVTSLPTQDQPSNVKAGDLNNDGYDDLVVSYQALAEVDFYFNVAGVSFTTQNFAVTTVPGNDLNDIEIMDIDNDDDLDVVENNQGLIEVFRNNGNSTFTNLADNFTGSYAYGCVSGDWNNDGYLDLGIANNSSGGISIKLNNAGTFASTTSFFSANAESVELCYGDFNLDGHLDIVTANDNAGNVTFMEGLGDGRFGSQSLLTGSVGGGVASGDFDEDGDIDIVGMNEISSAFSISLNNGDGTFGATQFWPIGFSADQVVVDDLTSEGHLDLITHSVNGFLIWTGNGDGTFQQYDAIPSSSPASGGPRTIVLGDFDGDGMKDIAGTFASADELSVCFADAIGEYSTSNVLTTGAYPRYLTAGDLNGDGIDDLAVTCNEANEVHVLYGSSSGTFSAPFILQTGNAPEGATIFDANEDGWNDIAIVSPNSNDYLVYMNNSGVLDGMNSGNLPSGSNAGGLTHADVNGDGHEDLIVAFYQSDNVGIMFGSGNGLFDPAITFDADQGPNLVITDYFNDDEAIDIAVLNTGTNNISVILNNAAFVNADGPVFFCEGGSVNLTASAGNNYSWNTGETTQTINVNQDGEYYCIIGNQAGTCDLLTASIVVDVEQVVNVSWSDVIADFCLNSEPFVLGGGQPLGGEYAGTGVSNGVFDPAEAGVGVHELTYIYDSNASCFEGTTSIEVEVFDALNVTLNLPDDSPCMGINYVLAGGSPAGGTYYFNSNQLNEIFTSDWGVGQFEVMYVYDQTQNCGGVATQTMTIESCTGVDEKTGETFIIYPTITTDEIFIQGEQPERVRVLDMSGRVVMDIIQPENNHVNLINLPAGIYFVEINETLKIKVQKI